MTQIHSKAEDIKEAKIKVREDWVNALPNLAAYAQNKLYKIVGPSVMGIELIKLPGTPEYRPHFVCYPLWKENPKECLNGSIILKEFYNMKGLQFSIPYTKHTAQFPEAVKSVKDQVSIPFDRNISLKILFDLIDDCFDDLLIKAHPGKQAALYQFKLYAALYVGNYDQVEKVLEQIWQESEQWNMQLFEAWYVTFHHWIKSLQEMVNHRDEFLAQIQANKQDKKLQKLSQSELVS